jgi:hypothetical protein
MPLEQWDPSLNSLQESLVVSQSDNAYEVLPFIWHKLNAKTFLKNLDAVTFEIAQTFNQAICDSGKKSANNAIHLSRHPLILVEFSCSLRPGDGRR